MIHDSFNFSKDVPHKKLSQLCCKKRLPESYFSYLNYFSIDTFYSSLTFIIKTLNAKRNFDFHLM